MTAEIKVEQNEPSFTPEKVMRVWNTLPQQDLITAMTEKGVAEIDAGNILKGELGRLLLLGIYHERFYSLPFDHLRGMGVLDGSSANELGPSLFAHFAVMNQKPESVKGVEVRPHIVNAARVAINSFQSAGFLPGGYEVVQGDHTVNLPKRDLSILSLVTQYGAAEQGTLNWLMANGKIGINGDVHHTYTPTDEAEVEAGKLTIKSLTQPDIDTGIAWKLQGRPKSTIFGDIYNATIAIDPKVIGPDQNAIYIPVEGDVLTGKVVVYRADDGSLAFQSWTLDPTEASDEEAAEVWAIWKTHEDIYRGMTQITDGKATWNSGAALAIPAYASKKGLCTAVMLTTANGLGLSGTIPLAIIRKNAGEARKLFGQGLLSQVGPGKKFESLATLYDRIQYWMQKGILDSKFSFSNPHLITTLTTADRDVFKQIVG